MDGTGGSGGLGGGARGRKAEALPQLTRVTTTENVDERERNKLWYIYQNFCDENADDMLMCDDCTTWFHFVCVGLEERRSPRRAFFLPDLQGHRRLYAGCTPRARGAHAD